MSKNDSPKKSNSYSLLLKGLSEIEKEKKVSKPTVVKESNTSSNIKMRKGKDSGASEPSQKKNNPPKPSDPNEPDRSYGDYYCTICDSHMNSDHMWEAHVTGKRHIKNVKKGENDSKYEDLPNEESAIKYELRNVKDPIVGLSYIHEIRRKEPNVPPLYNCFLCHASLATPPLVIEHVISMKHRMNYIKENNPEEYQLLEATNLKKGTLEPLVLETATRMEEQDGRGVVKVKQEKIKAPVTTWKRRDSDDEDDLRLKLHKKAKTDLDKDSWKCTETEKRSSSIQRNSRDYRDRMHYSDEDSRDSFARQSSKKRNTSPKRDDHYRSSRYSDKDDFHTARKSEYDSRKSEYDSRKSEYDSRKSEYDSQKSEYDRYRSEYNNRSSHSEYETRKDDARKLDHEKHLKKDYNLPSPPWHGQTRSYSTERLASNSDVYRSTPNEKYSSQSLQSHDDLLPHEKAMEQPKQSSELMFQNFVEKIMELPAAIFLKLVLVKLSTMQLKGIDELSLLSKVITGGQKVLHSQLPAEVQLMIAQKSAAKENNERKSMSGLTGLNLSSVSTNQVSQQTPKAISDAQTAQSFINELLSSARNSSNASQQKVPENNSYVPAGPPPPSPLNQTAAYPNTNPPQYQTVSQYQTNSSAQYPNANQSQNDTQYPNNYAPRPAQNYPINSSQPSTLSSIPGLSPPKQAPQASQHFNNFSNYSSTSTNKNYGYY